MLKSLLGVIAAIVICNADAAYVDNLDGTATDTATGLTWMRCMYGQTWNATGQACTGSAAPVTWNVAMVAPRGVAGQNDWRLPNVRELYTLADYSKNRPAYDSSIFLGTPGNGPLWSSTTASDWAVMALTVRFADGGFDKYGDPRVGKTSQGYARYVRGQETSRLVSDVRTNAVYLAHPDGTVLDQSTGLIWQPCLVGQAWTGAACAGTPGQFLFAAGATTAAADHFGGYSDWRVPTMAELLTLVDSARSKPALNTSAFPSATTGAVWSSTQNAGNSDYAWYIDLDYGTARTWTTSAYAFGLRLVRGGGRSGPYPGTAIITRNPYGQVSVVGAVLSGSVISNFTEDVEILFGSTYDGNWPNAEIEFNGLSLGAGRSLKVRINSPGKAVTLRNVDNTRTRIDGVLSMPGLNGQLAPSVLVQNAHGIETGAGVGAIDEIPAIVAPGGLTIDSRGSAPFTGGYIRNGSVLDGGDRLTLLGGLIQGSGAFIGNAVIVSTFDRANNPVHGSHYLDNAIHISPASGPGVDLTLNHYGPNPSYLNVSVDGNARIQAPSAWPAGSPLPNNNLPILPGTIRAMSDPLPSFGGGSMIVQATKNLTLSGGTTNDFVFPGGIAMKAGGTIDLAAVTLVNGWTTLGKPFQGLHFEAPSITTPSLTSIFSNALNWVNFSVQPTGHFGFFSLSGTGSYTQYDPSDKIVPHLNTYSILIDAAANGQCWTCLVNSSPIAVQ